MNQKSKARMKQFLLLGLLCLAPLSSFAAPAKTEMPLTRTLIDRDNVRSIEIVTDRRESVAQFFARQQLAVAIWPTLDGKFVKETSQWSGDKPRKLFVSYPLFNDEQFKMSLYGAFYEVSPLAPEVLSLLRDEAAPSSHRTLLVLAPGEKTDDRMKQTARVVGRIRVFGSWLPDSEESLHFASKQSATN